MRYTFCNEVEAVTQLCFISHAAVQVSSKEVLPPCFCIVVGICISCVFLSLAFLPFASSRHGDTKLFPKLSGAAGVSQTLSLSPYSPLAATSRCCWMCNSDRLIVGGLLLNPRYIAEMTTRSHFSHCDTANLATPGHVNT